MTWIYLFNHGVQSMARIKPGDYLKSLWVVFPAVCSGDVYSW